MTVDTWALRRISNDTPGSVTSNLQKAAADEIDNLRNALDEARAMIARFRKIVDCPELTSVFAVAAAHGCKYTGPMLPKAEIDDLLRRTEQWAPGEGEPIVHDSADDIVKRLRGLDGTSAITTLLDAISEAATEIERLRGTELAKATANFMNLDQACDVVLSAAKAAHGGIKIEHTDTFEDIKRKIRGH